MRGEYTEDTRSHRLLGAKLWVGSSRSSGDVLTRDANGLLFMQPVGCAPRLTPKQQISRV